MMGHGPEEPMAEEAAEPSPSQEEASERRVPVKYRAPFKGR